MAKISDSIKKIHIAVDQDLFWINKEHIHQLPYFKIVLSNPESYGLGTESDPIRLDFNIEDIQNVVEYLRNGEQYQLNEKGAYAWNQLVDPVNIPTRSDFMTIDVGTITISTTKATLEKLQYFNALFNIFKSPLPKILDRNGTIFKILLSNLRNPLWEFPSEYNYELNFFGGYTNAPTPTDVLLKPARLTEMIIPSLSHNDPNDVGYIAQDVYLTANPQITFNKMVYRRYTYYESGDILIEGAQDKNIIIFEIPKQNIDLITGELYIFLSMASDVLYDNLLLDIVDKVELKSGDEVIAANTGKLNNVLCNTLYNHNRDALECHENSSREDECIELFFYNKHNNGLTLPNITIASNLKVYLTLKRDIKVGSKLFVGYNKLFGEEIRRFRTVSHEYLISEWKEISHDFSSNSFEIPMEMNGSFSIFFFEIIPQNYNSDNFNSSNYLRDITLYMNLKPRKYINSFISKKNFRYLRGGGISPNIYGMIFDQIGNIASYNTVRDDDTLGYNTQHYPSGHISFGPTDKCHFEVNLNCSKGTINIYAKTYNVLRIHANTGVVGMGYKHYIKEVTKVKEVQEVQEVNW